MNLTNFLKENPNSRKIFGKEELRIIEFQLNGISLTQSEKNRLSRDIRPKLEFIKECSRFQDQFKLKKGDINKQLIQEAKEEILNDKLRNNIKKILLFGSVVENQLTVRSDIDIAVIFKKINLKEATEFRIRIAGEVNDKIDIQVFKFLPNKIKNEIIKKHKVLYEQNKW